jgi:NADH:ubiquinone oxidoreductase subunit 3 (subunit A)
MRRKSARQSVDQFNIRFYVFALIFIIFDVEAALLPWAVVFKAWAGLVCRSVDLYCDSTVGLAMSGQR